MCVCVCVCVSCFLSSHMTSFTRVGALRLPRVQFTPCCVLNHSTPQPPQTTAINFMHRVVGSVLGQRRWTASLCSTEVWTQLRWPEWEMAEQLNRSCVAAALILAVGPVPCFFFPLCLLGMDCPRRRGHSCV